MSVKIYQGYLGLMVATWEPILFKLEHIRVRCNWAKNGYLCFFRSARKNRNKMLIVPMIHPHLGRETKPARAATPG